MLRFLLNCPPRAVTSGGVVAAFFTALLCTLSPTAAAQQFVVDDAGITEQGACQIEAWLSQSAGWVLPACTPISRAELTLGVGFVDGPHGDHVHRHTEWLAQAKVNFIEDAPGALGASVVAGFGFGPFAQATGMPLEGVFAYVPATYTLANEQAMLHGNLGWSFDLEASLHRLIYGIRGELMLHDRATVIWELFGEGPDVGIQGGLRITIVPDLFDIDATYGVALAGDTPDIGLALGIALTPPPFFRPIGR